MSESPPPGRRPWALVTWPWTRFRARHLHDYPSGAVAAWLAIVFAGLASLAGAVAVLLARPPEAAWLLLALLVSTLVAATLAIRIPRSTVTISVADIFLFLALATHGPAGAMLAAWLENVMALWRTSGRLSSRLASPAAAATGWLVTGAVHLALVEGLGRVGLPSGIATMVSLCLVAPLPYVASAAPLLAMMALKRGEPLRPRSWFAATIWSALVSVGSGLVAALLHLASLGHGPVVLAASGAMVLALAWLVRQALAAQARERDAQEAAVSAARDAADRSQARFEAAFMHAAIGMLVLDADGCVVEANAAAARLLDVADPSALVGRPCESLVDPQHRVALRLALSPDPEQAPPRRPPEVRLAGGRGTTRWVALHCGHPSEARQAHSGRILQLHDVSARRAAEARLHRFAYHDPLTGLANRLRFHQVLEAAIDRARDDPRQAFAVMCLDLDRFKTVNDSLGHHTGNELLRMVAQRLAAEVRPTDLVARLGGDEFAVLVTGADDPELPMHLARRMIQSLQQPVPLGTTEVSIGASIGVTASDLGHRSVDEVLRDADIAMYEAKAGGRRSVARFDAGMLARVADKLELEADLRRAISDDALSLNFQPLFALDDDRLVGFEALVRWTHPRRGAVPPSAFVPLAEETGLIEPLTDWVLDRALSHLGHWQRRWPEAPQLVLHVNISSRDLGRLTFIPWVREALQRHRVRTGTLTLEITETSLMERMDTAMGAMEQLRPDGVQFSIDDFGTGYSSLAYLGRLPIESLKIDQSFVAGLQTQPQHAEIVRAIVDLGRALGRHVVAEGIETPEQLAALRGLGVGIGQGYLLARPLPVDAVEALLERRFSVATVA